MDLGEKVHNGNFKGTELYPKVYDIHHKLEAAETEMKFLSQMIQFEKTAQSKLSTMEENTGENGEEQQEFEQIEENELDVTDAPEIGKYKKLKVSSYIGIPDREELRLRTLFSWVKVHIVQSRYIKLEDRGNIKE